MGQDSYQKAHFSKKSKSMTTSFKNNVAAQVVGEFLTKLKGTEIDSDISKRLKETILTHEKVSETALRSAIFDSSDDD